MLASIGNGQSTLRARRLYLSQPSHAPLHLLGLELRCYFTLCTHKIYPADLEGGGSGYWWTSCSHSTHAASPHWPKVRLSGLSPVSALRIASPPPLRRPPTATVLLFLLCPILLPLIPTLFSPLPAIFALIRRCVILRHRQTTRSAPTAVFSSRTVFFA
jgi:hypothetical protein